MVNDVRRRHWRSLAVLLAIMVAFGFLLTCCPANRDGMPGQLAQAMKETAAAARSGALAVELWIQRRATDQLTAVQLTDARDEIVDAYQGIAELRAEDPVDIERQRMLTDSMTRIIGQLNAAAAAVRRVSGDPSPEKARADLVAAAVALETGYR